MGHIIQIKKKLWLIMIALLTVALIVACTPVNSTESAIQLEQVTMFVGSETARCVGVAPTTCLLVKFYKEAEWELFYDNIDGFEYESGFEYELLVTKTDIENPPADTSSIQYALVEVVSKMAVTDSLAGTDWDLVSLDSTEVGNGLTLLFSADTVSGSDGCNSFSGSYTVENGMLVIDGNSLIVTRMACPDSDSEMAQRYISALFTAGHFTLENDQLKVTTDEGELLYMMAKSAELSNIQWQLSGLNDGNSITYMKIDKNIIMVLDSHQVSGHSGCNSFNGEVTIDGNQLSFGSLASTLMLCSEDDVNEREAEFLATLNAVASYEIVRQTLNLYDANENLMATFVISEVSDGSVMTDNLVGTIWQWIRFENSTGGKNIEVNNPTNYTIEFLTGGMYAIEADCNSGGGIYTANDGDLTLEPGLLTLAECSPDSFSDEFVNYLGNVTTYLVDDLGNLVLELTEGTMLFLPVQ